MTTRILNRYLKTVNIIAFCATRAELMLILHIFDKNIIGTIAILVKINFLVSR